MIIFAASIIDKLGINHSLSLNFKTTCHKPKTNLFITFPFLNELIDPLWMFKNNMKWVSFKYKSCHQTFLIRRIFLMEIQRRKNRWRHHCCIAVYLYFVAIMTSRRYFFVNSCLIEKRKNTCLIIFDNLRNHGNVLNCANFGLWVQIWIVYKIFDPLRDE